MKCTIYIPVLMSATYLAIPSTLSRLEEVVVLVRSDVNRPKMREKMKKNPPTFKSNSKQANKNKDKLFIGAK